MHWFLLANTAARLGTMPVARDLEHLLRPAISSMIANLRSPMSRATYKILLKVFFAWHRTHAPEAALDRQTVQKYRAHLLTLRRAPGTINLVLVILRRLAMEAAAEKLISVEAAQSITQIKSEAVGEQRGNWLTRTQAEQLLNSPDPNTLRGRRDRALLAVLLGCGLRRGELCALRLDHLQLRQRRWVIWKIVGKGQRLRSIPMPAWAKGAVDDWCAAAGISRGVIFRPIYSNRSVGRKALDETTVRNIVVRYAKKLGWHVTPHDMRRTFATQAAEGGADLKQIQFSLGHKSIQTTEKYLRLAQNFERGPCDALRFALRPADLRHGPGREDAWKTGKKTALG